MLFRLCLLSTVLALSACSSGSSSPAPASEDLLLDEVQAAPEPEPEPDPQITTASGLMYEILRPAEGPQPTADSVVTLDYAGTLTDGTVFDSSYDRGQASSFELSNTIEGFKEGVQLMSVGSHYRFTIPPELGYGKRGVGDTIGPNETLIFEVELHEINS